MRVPARPRSGGRISPRRKLWVEQAKRVSAQKGRKKNPAWRDTLQKRTFNAFMANTKSLGKEERKKAKRAARKKRKAEKPLGKRTVPRGSAKRKVKKMVRGQAKR